MADKPLNTYSILKNCLTGTTSSELAAVSNTYDVFRTVYDSGNTALQVKFVSPITIDEDVTIDGNLVVLGAVTAVTQVDLNVLDNTITLNSGETGAGVTLVTSGLNIDRGTETWAVLYWDESVSGWTAGLDGSQELLATQPWVTDNFLSGDTSFYTQAQADANFLSGDTINKYDQGVGFWDDATMKLQTDSDFIWDGSQITLNGNMKLADLSANTLEGSLNWSWITNEPTTIGGYGITDAYTKTEVDANFLSASTSITTSLSSLTDVTITSLASNDVLIYSGSEWVNTGTTLFNITAPASGDTVIYSSGEWVNQDISGNYLSASTSYYTQAEADANFLSASTSIGASELWVTNNFLSANTSYYTQAEVDANTLSASTSFYTQAEADANFLSASTQLSSTLSGLTDVTVTSIQTNDVLVWTGSAWENTGVTTVTATDPTSGQTLVYDTGVWVNQDTLEQIDFQINFETGTTYKITPYSHYDFEVVSMYIEADSGNCTLTLSGNSSAMGGISSVTGGTTGTVYTASSNNDISVGESVEMIVEANDAAEVVYGSIKIKRT